jgi:hypothetical protein
MCPLICIRECLVAFCMAILKGRQAKAYPYLSPFVTSNGSEREVYTRMLDDVFSIVALSILVQFPGIPSSSIVLYRCILITESHAALKLKRKCVSIFLSCSFSRICCRMNKALMLTCLAVSHTGMIQFLLQCVGMSVHK